MANGTLGKDVGMSISKAMKSIGDASGLSYLDASIENFTKKIEYSKLYKDLSSGSKLLKINETSIPVKNGAKDTSLFNSLEKQVNKFDKTIEIKKYLAPTTLAIKSLDSIGKEIDKSIESSFLLQSFNIKGTDIICSAFCFLLSTLPCSERTNLYKAFYNASKAAQTLKAGSIAANRALSAIGGVAASVDSIKQSASKLFNEPISPKDVLGEASTLAAAPMAILNNLKIISNALKLGLNFKFIMPDSAGKGLWDLSRHVLYMIESQGMQMADEALSKAIKPIEDLLKELTPSICFGNQATKIQNMIMATIKSFKDKLLDMLRKLMVDNKEFNIKFTKSNLQSAFLLEINAFMEALDYISSHFFDVARACGLSPCSPTIKADQIKSSDIGNLEGLRDSLFKESTSSPSIINSSVPLIGDNIDDIANKFATNTNNTYVTPTNIISIYDLGDVPKKIIELVENGTLNKLLDDNYSIYNDNGNIKVVYNTKRNCGD